jgi:hypothetical protein
MNVSASAKVIVKTTEVLTLIITESVFVIVCFAISRSPCVCIDHSVKRLIPKLAFTSADVEADASPTTVAFPQRSVLSKTNSIQTHFNINLTPNSTLLHT